MGDELRVEETPIPGMFVVRLAVHGDSRGWFKENWQREKMVSLGVPDFAPVQNNISFNTEIGVTRGLHAEPWDKFVALATGRIFGAWVDLRDGESFGRTFTCEIDENTAVYVPRGVGNGYQTLEPDTAYTYLVNDHWSPEASYTFVNLADSDVAVPWPIPLEQAVISDKDRHHGTLAQVVPFRPQRTAILGAGGQLARALVETAAEWGREVDAISADQLDLTDAAALTAFRWRDYDVVVNAAAYTNVDGAERAEGRAAAWRLNAAAVADLARLSDQHGFTLVHVSTDYVFDGSQERYDEEAPLAPLSVYGQSKAAGDLAAATARRCYVARTSWLVGDGKNFVATMASLGRARQHVNVVSDQSGRLTFATDLARAIWHLVGSQAPYGVYNVTCDGDTTSWAEIARRVYELVGADPALVTPVTTEEYFAGKTGIAPRPVHSTLDLGKLRATGFAPRQAEEALVSYLRSAPPA